MAGTLRYQKSKLLMKASAEFLRIGKPLNLELSGLGHSPSKIRRPYSTDYATLHKNGSCHKLNQYSQVAKIL